MIQRIAKSIGAGFAEKFNQEAEEEIYAFECDNRHRFYIEQKIPVSITDLTAMLEKVQCPVCQNKLIKMRKCL